ncbi:MAG: hypothetical protein IJC50_05620 [Clostridia bacterium]|nr:hypothetical protein [Clostridia bacterium]
MNKDKELYRHIYNFVKLREMNLPSAYEYQEKYGLRFNEVDVEDAFFKETVSKTIVYIYNTADTERSDNLSFWIIIGLCMFLEVLGVLPVTMIGRIVTFAVLAVIQYTLASFLEYLSRRRKTDYLYLVHTDSYSGGADDDRC